jgi:VWFA-related protein
MMVPSSLSKSSAIQIKQLLHLLPCTPFAISVLIFVAWGQNTKFTTEVNVVNVLTTVVDKDGRIIKGLTAADFRMEEDGHPQKIEYFSQQTDLPLIIGLLVDTSGSMSRMFEEEKAASSAFFRQVLRPRADRAYVINFDKQVTLQQKLTSSRKDLEGALARMETRVDFRNQGAAFAPAGRSTALYDAIYSASEAIMKKQGGRKALIVISDGMDIQSENSLEDAIAAAQRAVTLVYSIRMYDPLQPSIVTWTPYDPLASSSPDTRVHRAASGLEAGKDALRRISRETGGSFFDVSQELSLQDVYEHIQNELRNQYNLGYRPDLSRLGPGFHKLRVETRMAGLNVQARDGYYLEKQ